MFKKKRGLSAIVATLIVILLAIVAFGIVSGVFQDLISDRTERAEAESSDLRLDIQRVDVEGNKSNVTLQRKGSDNVELVGANFVFKSGNSNAVMERNFSLDTQERDVISMPLCSEEFSDVDLSSESLSVTVYPIIDFEGKKVLIESQASNIDFVNVGDYSLEDCSSEDSSQDSGEDSGSGDGTSDGDGSGSDGNSDSGEDSGSDDGSQDNSCVDSDGDSWNSTASCNRNDVADCDDSRADVNPGHEEVCGDGIDNNCDGEIDEGCGGLICDDGDNDGYVEDKNYLYCSTPTGDCNDSDSNINPGASEACGDGIDNDCDENVDEGCGGFEVIEDEIQVVFDSPSNPPEIPRELHVENTGGRDLEIEAFPQSPIRPYINMQNQFTLREGSTETLEVIFQNPGQSRFRAQGYINFTSADRGFEDDVFVRMGVR